MLRTLIWIAIFYLVYRLAQRYLSTRSSRPSGRSARGRFADRPSSRTEDDRRSPMRDEWIDRSRARDATFRDLE